MQILLVPVTSKFLTIQNGDNCLINFLSNQAGVGIAPTATTTPSVCLLSGDTAETAAPNAFQVQPGATYNEKECDPRSIAGGEFQREALRPYPPSADPFLSDPRPYPPAGRDPFSPNRLDPYPSQAYPYPTSANNRDPFSASRFPITSRDPYPTRDYYPPRDRDRDYGRDPYPSRDPYYQSRYPPGRDAYNTLRDPYPSSAYPGGGTPDPGSNYLDPELSPYRCRHTVTYEKVLGHTYNGARK